MAMRSDLAHKWIDRRLAAMEKRIAGIYEEAHAEVEKKLSDFTAQFQAKATEKFEDMKAGKIDEAEYQRWLRTQLFITDEWKLTREMLAHEYGRANEIALAYVNGEMPRAWSIGYNAIGKTAEGAVSGYTFHLVDADTVRLLATDNSLLLPPPTKKLNIAKDKRWNIKKINNQIRQGILQGESIGDIASRLQKVSDMNRAGALRNARTMITAAENRGRMASYDRLTRDGFTVEREWIAAHDFRTRHAHSVFDGQKKKQGEPFVYEGDAIMYPGDPAAKPYLVYNCRCTVGAELVEYKGKDIRTSYYEEGKVGDGTEEFEKKRDEAQKRKGGNRLTGTKKRAKISMQHFAESDIKNQESASLKRAIRKYQKRIEEHQRKIDEPERYIPDWEQKIEQEKNGLKKHWQKEIKNFHTAINDRIAELKERGDYDE